MPWQLQDAKQQFSRLVDRARSDGPQIVTRHGREVAVVISMEDYRLLGGGSLKDALRALADEGAGEFAGIMDGIAQERRSALPRDLELDV